MPYDGSNFETKPDLSDLMDDEILRTLVEADALLSDRSKWHKGDYVRDGAMCIYGALAGGDEDKASRIHGCGPVSAFIEAQLTEFVQTDESVGGWNDLSTTTFADVKALFARAIDARAKALRCS